MTGLQKTIALRSILLDINLEVSETHLKYTFFQIGKKPRNGAAHLGACFVSPENSTEFVLAARPNGRLWEANNVGVVYQ